MAAKGGPFFVTEASPRQAPSGSFAGALWPPQEAVLHRMVQAEKTLAPCAGPLSDGEGFLRSTHGKLSADFSFGKTVVCIALIANTHEPRAGAESVNHLSREMGTPLARGGAVTGHYVRHSHFLGASLVVVSPSVLTQWVAACAAFAPSLRRLVIENCWDLRRFAKMFTRAGGGYRAPAYDIVLVKAGTVSSAFTVEGEAPCGLGRKTRSTVAAVAVVSAGYQWKRVIVDDFDTIGLTARDVLPVAGYTWYISATNRQAAKAIKSRRPGGEPPAIPKPAVAPLLDPLIGQFFSIGCCPRFMRQAFTTPETFFRRVRVQGGGEGKLLKSLGVSDEVIEMAASGAVETAAEKLNIQAASLREIVTKVLAKHADDFRRASRTVSRAAEARRRLAAAAAGPAADSAFCRALVGAPDPEFEACLAERAACGGGVGRGLESAENAAKAVLSAHRGRLDRLRSNVSEGACGCCTVPFDDGEDEAGDGCFYITDCCQIAICHYCAFSADRRRFLQRCVKCLEPADPRRWVFVSADARRAEAFDARGFDEAFAGACAPPAEPPPARRHPPRLQALVDLVVGAVPVACLGAEELPPPEAAKAFCHKKKSAPKPEGLAHKTLIFAMYPEAARSVFAALCEAGARGVARFLGTRRQRDQVLARFKSGDVDTLIVSTNNDCAGLHLPEVTHLVFYHHHREKEVVQQAIGRALRAGRRYDLTITEIVDEYETSTL